MAAPEYLDFDLELAPAAAGEAGAGAGYLARVLASPRGEAEAPVTIPFGADRLENVILKLGRTRSGVRRIGSPQQQLAREFGAELYDAVFAGEVGTCFRRSLDEAERQGKGLRIRLRLTDTPDLAPVPWEYLFSTGLGRFLVLSSKTPLVRYLDLPRDVSPLLVAPPLRVLLVVSGPRDLATLDTAREVRNLSDALAELTRRGLVVIDPLPKPTLAELRHALRRNTYHMLHFIGHGGYDERSGDGVLAFEDDNGLRHLVSGGDLGTLLHDHDTLRLAVLNACEGARTSPRDPFSGAAQSLVQQGIPAVVAMQFEITDEAAIAFSHEFYAAISDGYPVDAALADGRKAVFTTDNDVEWGTPVLYLRARDGKIFDVTPGASSALQRVADPTPTPAEPTPHRPTEPAPVAPATPTASAHTASTPTEVGPAAPDPRTQPGGVPIFVPTGPGPSEGPAPSAGPPVIPLPAPRPLAGPSGGSGGSGPNKRRRLPLVLGGALGGIVALLAFFGWLGSRPPDEGSGTPTTAASSSAVTSATGAAEPTVSPSDTAQHTPTPLREPPPLAARRGTQVVDAAPCACPDDPGFVSETVIAGSDTGVRATWHLWWDDQALYVLAEVTDRVVAAPWADQPSQLYRGDSVSLEIGRDARALGTDDKLRRRDGHVIFGVKPEGTVIATVNRPTSDRTTFTGSPDTPWQAAARLVPGGYMVEGAIEWSAIGVSGVAEGGVLAANLNVSDVNADTDGLAEMASTNPNRDQLAQPHPRRWQQLALQG